MSRDTYINLAELPDRSALIVLRGLRRYTSKEVFYDIHGLVKIKVASRYPKVWEGYDHYFRAFECEKFDAEADYEIRDFSDFTVPPEQKDLGNGWRGFDTGAYSPHERYGFTYKNGKVKEYVSYANRATNFWLQMLLVPRGMSLVHAAGLEMGGKGVLFPGFGGVGKTLLVAALRDRKDTKFFGDDFVIVDGKGRMRSFPSDFSIYPYHLEAFPELKGSLAAGYLKRRKIFAPWYFMKRAVNFVAKRTVTPGRPLFNGWLALYAKVPAAKLFPKERHKTEVLLAASIFLRRGDGADIRIAPLNSEVLVERMVNILHDEFGEGIHHVRALEKIGLIDWRKFVDDERTILTDCFSRVRCYEAVIPTQMSPTTYREHIVDEVDKILE